MDDASDELLRRCQQGDDRALADMVREYQERIFRLACRVTGNATLAEEATAQALLKIWTRANQWRGQARASTWIYRLAVRTILDVQRSQKRWWRRWAGESKPRLFAGPDASAELERQAEADRVQEAVQQLAEGDRALVHLYYFESRSLPEIETILGVPRETLKMRLARARQKLRPLLEGNDGEC